LIRVAVIDRERCKPDDCNHECHDFCPEVRMGVQAVQFTEKKPVIVEQLCTGCGICVKKCPFDAITIVNLPDKLEAEYAHVYGPNAFTLFRLPVPQEATITGIVGRNGTGKTTCLRILSGDLVPNLGRYQQPPGWEEVIKHFGGTLIQNYLRQLRTGKIRVVHKPQYVEKIPQLAKGKVSSLLERVDQRGRLAQLVEGFDLRKAMDSDVSALSGGELQRVALCAALARDADVYIFDEPSSHLDVSQRLNAAKAIRGLASEGKTVLLAEHDLAMLDYLSDQVCLIYGEPGAYGIVSRAHSTKVGINIYLDGFIPDENMRFRPQPIRFHVKPPREAKEVGAWSLKWGRMEKIMGPFQLAVEPGEVAQGDVVGVFGPNGIGKTTFIKLLAGMEVPTSGERLGWTGIMVSYKPQHISAQYKGSVQHLLMDIVGEERFGGEKFQAEYVDSLGLKKFLDRDVEGLSGGELQRVAIAVALARDAQIYLIDEPCAYLDVEERLSVARLIRKVVEERKAFAFVVEHDIVAQDFIADRLMVFDGEPGVRGVAHPPADLRTGMNQFLSRMDMTFRRDTLTGRPRVNKPGSRLDREQRALGEYYYIPEREIEIG